MALFAYSEEDVMEYVCLNGPGLCLKQYIKYVQKTLEHERSIQNPIMYIQ